MQHFIAGFAVALAVGIPLTVMLLRKKSQTPKTDKDEQFEELGKLTGELAHEIKNPLSTIKINLKLTAEELEELNTSSDKNQQGFARALRKIGVIRKEADRLEQILDSFLRYIDRTDLQLATVDINELVGDMVDFYSPQALSHSITIRQGLYTAPLVCKVDADMLKQVMLNLFINAQQAMDNGGKLMIRTDKQLEYAVIEVSDTGCGIAPDKLPSIFEAYYSSRPQGSGLGLPTAKRIVETHKGTLSVTSQLGKGTLFTIKLPIQKTNEASI